MGGGTKSVTSEAKWFDPLGPNGGGGHGPTGGPERRATVFGQLDGVRQGVSDARGRVLNSLYNASGQPGFGVQQDLANRALRGDYLSGGPPTDAAVSKMRAASDREGSNDEADQRSRMQRAGVLFSTPSSNAAAAARTARTAAANTSEAQMRSGIHNQERQYQIGSGGQLKESLAGPIDFLSQLPKASYAGMGDEGQILSGLAGNGAYITPNVQLYKQPGALDYASQIMGSL